MKNLILEHLHKLLEDNGYRIAPQDYGAEFRQTGSGKSIFGVPNKDITPEKLNKVMAELAIAKQISVKYKKAWQEGEEGIFVIWQGKKMLMRIPKELRTATDPNGEPVDYSNYFDVPTVGDGGFQFKLYKNGNMVAANVRSKPDIQGKADLGSATDAGYEKTYDDRIKYFFVKAGIMAKYQEEVGRFGSVLDTPAIDASVKVRVIFHDEILDFLKKGASYTADKKGAAIANKMEFEKKLEKIRKDAEQIIGKPIYGNKSWMEFRDNLIQQMDTPEKQMAMDVNSMTKDFVDIYKIENPARPVGKPEISLDPEELDAAEKQRELIKARIAAARARKNK